MNPSSKFHGYQNAGASWKYLLPSNTVKPYILYLYVSAESDVETDLSRNNLFLLIFWTMPTYVSNLPDSLF